MDPQTRKYLAEIGRKGGQRSRRRLEAEQARTMVRVREARRAYRRFHAQCFWSSPPDLEIGADDVAWVAEQLKRHGGSEAWRKASQLCR
jgi:general stress protein YciG